MGADDAVRSEPNLGPPSSRDVLGKYRLIARLARGGMGVVYIAVLRGPGGFHKLVAIKELRRDFAEDEGLVAMFMDEARLAAQLNHPNVVQTTEVGTSGGRHFMVMEYLEGQSLQRVIGRAQERGVAIPLHVHLAVQTELLAALDHAHELADLDGSPLGVVHRDVSPHNVFLTYEGQVKLIDFGIAKADRSAGAHDDDWLEGSLKGKTRYMAPEQARGGRIDARADLFSVGVMLWEALAGRRAWEGRSEAAVLDCLSKGEVPRARDARPDVDGELAAILDGALSADPAGRPASARAMRSALEHYVLARTTTPSHTRTLGALVSQLFAEDRRRLRAIVDAQLRALEAEAARRPSTLPPTPMNMTVAASDPPVESGSRTPAATAAASTGPVPFELDLAAFDTGRRSGVNDAPTPASPSRAPSASNRADLRAAIGVGDDASFAVRTAPVPAWPVDARVVSDGSGAGAVTTSARSRGVWVFAAAALGASVALLAFAVGRSSASGIVAAGVVSPPRRVDTIAAAVPQGPSVRPPVHVVIRASPSSARVYVDDVRVPNPYVADRARDGSAHAVRVEARGYETKTSAIAFASDIDVAIALAAVDEPAPAAPPPRPAMALHAAPPAAAPPSASASAAEPPRRAPKPIETGNPYLR